MPTESQSPETVCASSENRNEQFDEVERLLSLCEVQAIRSGVPLPLGASTRNNGVNFGVFSRHATGPPIHFFYRFDDSTPARTSNVLPPGRTSGFRARHR